LPACSKVGFPVRFPVGYPEGATPAGKAEEPPEESHSYIKIPPKNTNKILMPFIISVNFDVYNTGTRLKIVKK
jgi:hypothetical protein